MATDRLTLAGEIWKPIPNFPHYAVSSLGRFRSLDNWSRNGKNMRLNQGQILRTAINPLGYVQVCLRRDGKKTTARAHRVVCAAFNGEKPTDKHVVNHIDGNPSNNIATNLEWVTQSENVLHSYRMGRKPSSWGENSKQSKLKAVQVREIRRRAALGVSRRELSERFGVSLSNINLIVNRKSWKHIKDDAYTLALLATRDDASVLPH